MFQRSLSILLILCLLLPVSVFAVDTADVPVTPTQDAVLSLTAAWQDERKISYDLQVMPADQRTMDTVSEIYKFVVEENNRPVRYFPEETQKAIEVMINGIDPDALYMTEFMRLHAAEGEPSDNMDTVMVLDVDYQPGQLVVAVLGDTADGENTVWTPVETQVTALGEVQCVIPQELMGHLQGKDLFFSLLTVRKGSRGGIVEHEKSAEHVELPSKTAYDIVHINTIVTEDRTPAEESFELLVTEESSDITKELSKIRTHVKDRRQPFSAYLPEASQDEIRQLLNENSSNTRKEDLVIYEYLPLITKDYKESYGNVIASFQFATPYSEGQQVITVLGLPKLNASESDSTRMNWYVQRAQVKTDGFVEIVFSHQVLSGMGMDTGLLLVLSEPLAE